MRDGKHSGEIFFFIIKEQSSFLASPCRCIDLSKLVFTAQETMNTNLLDQVQFLGLPLIH
jgi:hypothetical protein